MDVRPYSEVDKQMQAVVRTLKSSRVVNRLTSAQAKIHKVSFLILKNVKAIGGAIKGGYDAFIKPEIVNVKVSAEKMIMKKGTKKIKNSVKMVASVLFLTWTATLPVSLVYHTTIRWIDKAAIAVQPYWTWFSIATTSLAIANAVFGSINTVLSIKKMKRAQRLLKSSTVGETPMMESILKGVKKNAIQKMFTEKTVGLTNRLTEIQNSGDENLKKETEALLEGRIRSVIKIQRMLLVSNLISVIGSSLILSGVPMIGIPIALIGSAVVGGIQIYAQVKTYRFENKIGMVVVAPHQDTGLIRKRDQIKSFVKWKFAAATPAPAKAKLD